MPCTVFVSVGVVCSLRLEHVRCQHQAAGTVRHRTSTVLAGRQTDRQTYPLLLLLSQPTPVSALVCLCLHMPRTSLAACPFRTLWVLVLLRSTLLCSAAAEKMSKLIFVGRKTFQFSLHVRVVSPSSRWGRGMRGSRMDKDRCIENNSIEIRLW